MAKLLLVLGVLGVLLGAATSRATADGAATGADLHVAQSLGDRELTVIIRRVDAPGPLRVEVVTHAGTPAGRLQLRVSTAGAAVGVATVQLGQTPGFYDATLDVDRSGWWELAVDDGARVATIPFLVQARVSTPWETVTYGGFGAAGVLLLVALGLAVLGRTGLAMVPAAGMIAALAAAITAGLLSPVSQRASTVDYPPSPVNLVATAHSADLRLHLSDATTGQPVDDIVVRDNALLHLMVVTPSGGLRHLHPIRVAPGDYRARLTSGEPGVYAIAAELARRGGGTQLVRASVRVDTASDAPRRNDGSAELTNEIRPAGAPSTITADFGTATLQPWLGMLGHLIVVGPVAETAATAPVWAHVHAMLPATPGFPDRPDESVAAFGPTVRFGYTFPLPGRYLVWVQAERDYSVITVPAVIEVPEAGAHPSGPHSGPGHPGHQTR